MDSLVPTPELALALETATEAQLLAALEVMFFVAAADGSVGADELRGFLRLAKKASALTPSAVSGLITQWKARGRIDVASRAAELGAILSTPELRRAAYELATRTATADGQLGQEEAQLLEIIADALGVG